MSGSWFAEAGGAAATPVIVWSDFVDLTTGTESDPNALLTGTTSFDGQYNTVPVDISGVQRDGWTEGVLYTFPVGAYLPADFDPLAGEEFVFEITFRQGSTEPNYIHVCAGLRWDGGGQYGHMTGGTYVTSLGWIAADGNESAVGRPGTWWNQALSVAPFTFLGGIRYRMNSTYRYQVWSPDTPVTLNAPSASQFALTSTFTGNPTMIILIGSNGTGSAAQNVEFSVRVGRIAAWPA